MLICLDVDETQLAFYMVARNCLVKLAGVNERMKCKDVGHLKICGKNNNAQAKESPRRLESELKNISFPKLVFHLQFSYSDCRVCFSNAILTYFHSF